MVKPIDCILFSAKTFVGRVIRLFTAHRSGKNTVKEVFRQRIANHCGLIVNENGVIKIAEMLKTGLELNPLSDYFREDCDDIVAVRRLPFTDEEIAWMNKFVLSLHYTGTISYGNKEVCTNFVKIARNVPKDMYCSELAEIVVNTNNRTWNNYQLGNRKEAAGIAPCEIQFGHGKRIFDAYPE